MTEVLIVAVLLGVFSLIYLFIYGWLKSVEKSDSLKDFEASMCKAKEKLAELLGAPGVTDEVKSDLIITDWIICYSDKNRHLAGMSANEALSDIKTAGRLAKSGELFSAKTYLDRASRQLNYLETQVCCFEPQ